MNECRERCDDCATRIATLGPVGTAPVAPGTWASLLAALVWFLILSRFTPKWFWRMFIPATALAIGVAGRAEKRLGKDASEIVIDEVVGQWLSLALAPRSLKSMIWGFLLFRLFDIWKPTPIRSAETLNGGCGVVADDLLAGLFARVALKLFVR